MGSKCLYLGFSGLVGLYWYNDHKSHTTTQFTFYFCSIPISHSTDLMLSVHTGQECIFDLGGERMLLKPGVLCVGVALTIA